VRLEGEEGRRGEGATCVVDELEGTKDIEDGIAVVDHLAIHQWETCRREQQESANSRIR